MAINLQKGQKIDIGLQSMTIGLGWDPNEGSHHGRPPPQRPQRPLASHPGDALGRLRNNPSDEEDSSEQTATTTLTLHIFKTTPE